MTTTKTMFSSNLLICAFITMLTLVGCIFNVAHAQGTIRADQKYLESVNKSQLVQALGPDSFGAKINLKNGLTSFSYTDIDIPGNSSIPVRLDRKLAIDDKAMGSGELSGFGDFGYIDVPYLRGIFAPIGWTVSGSDQTKRCSAPSVPPQYSSVNGQDYWTGNSIHIPWEGDETMLSTPNSSLPSPSDGLSYPWTTKTFWRFRCITSTKNGSPLEAFVAVAPNGNRYYFDYMVSKPFAGYSKRTGNFGQQVATQRIAVFFLATRIEDRFGNYVNYQYSGDQLNRIESNDGRFIQVSSRQNDRVLTIASSRGTWTYQYLPNQLIVTNPDSSTWKMTSTGELKMYPVQSLPYSSTTATCPPGEGTDGSYSLAVQSPSGSLQTYFFKVARHWRHNIPKICNKFTDQAGAQTSYQFLTIPNFSDQFTLYERRLDGAGLATQIWKYTYGLGAKSIAWQANCTGPNVPVCPRSMKTEVRGPGDKLIRYMFGAWYQYNESELLATEEGSEVQNGSQVTQTIDRVITNTYVKTEEVANFSFPDMVGSDLVALSDDVSEAGLRPLQSVETKQAGANFVRRVFTFDVFGRPLRAELSSSPAP